MFFRGSFSASAMSYRRSTVSQWIEVPRQQTTNRTVHGQRQLIILPLISPLAEVPDVNLSLILCGIMDHDMQSTESKRDAGKERKWKLKRKERKTEKKEEKRRKKATSQSSIVLSGVLLLAQTKVTQLKPTQGWPRLSAFLHARSMYRLPGAFSSEFSSRAFRHSRQNSWVAGRDSTRQNMKKVFHLAIKELNVVWVSPTRCLKPVERRWRLKVDVPGTACCFATTDTSTLAETHSAVNAICWVPRRCSGLQERETDRPSYDDILTFLICQMSSGSPQGVWDLTGWYGCWALDALSRPTLRLRLRRLAGNIIRRLERVEIWLTW